MQKEVFSEFVPRQSLPPHVQKKFPQEEIVHVQYEAGSANDNKKDRELRPKFIQALKESEEAVKTGDVHSFSTHQEAMDFIQKKCWSDE